MRLTFGEIGNSELHFRREERRSLTSRCEHPSPRSYVIILRGELLLGLRLNRCLIRGWVRAGNLGAVSTQRHFLDNLLNKSL